MSTFEAIYLMLTFGLLIVAIMKDNSTKKNQPSRKGKLVIFATRN